jgi:hypothetical protein
MSVSADSLSNSSKRVIYTCLPGGNVRELGRMCCALDWWPSASCTPGFSFTLAA